jgi:hypothetical protein
MISNICPKCNKLTLRFFTHKGKDLAVRCRHTRICGFDTIVANGKYLMDAHVDKIIKGRIK